MITKTKPTFDMDGDISDETMNFIRSFSGEPWEWLDFCRACWDESYGRTCKSKVSIHFITGGWSCNELVIETMRKNYLMWSLCWESSHRGGLYRFEPYEDQ